jgi:hypothetical protein
MLRWQKLRESNYLKSRQMIEAGNHGYATQYQDLQQLCQEAITQFILEDWPPN